MIRELIYIAIILFLVFLQSGDAQESEKAQKYCGKTETFIRILQDDFSEARQQLAWYSRESGTRYFMFYDIRTYKYSLITIKKDITCVTTFNTHKEVVFPELIPTTK